MLVSQKSVSRFQLSNAHSGDKYQPYLIFVISFTQAGFLNPKFLHPKTTQNTQKLQQIPQKSVQYAVLRVQSGKFYTGQNFFTRAPPVVPATNMRYDINRFWFTADLLIRTLFTTLHEISLRLNTR